MKIEITGKQEKLASMARYLCSEGYSFSFSSRACKITVNLGSTYLPSEAQSMANGITQHTRLTTVVKR